MSRIILPVLLLGALPATAQETLPAPTQEDAAASSAGSADLAFEPVDLRMTVPVRIAGAGPFRFIIDTGAQRTVISRELAGTLGLAGGRDVRITSMTGASVSRTVTIPSISVSTLGGRQIEAPAIDARNIGAPGLLGIDALQGHSVGIDFDAKVMSLRPASRRTSRERHPPDEVVIRARSLFGQLVVTDAYVDGIRVRMVVDTGSPVSIGNEALRRRVAGRARPGPPIRLLGVTGEWMEAPYGSVTRVRLGSLTIGNLPVAFADVRPFQVFGLADKPAIMLGMDALRLFRRVEIDFANREVRMLLPRDVMKETG